MAMAGAAEERSALVVDHATGEADQDFQPPFTSFVKQRWFVKGVLGMNRETFCTIAASAALVLAWPVGASFGACEISEDVKLLASDEIRWCKFGNSVSVSGDLAIVGAPARDFNLGAAYVFRFDGTKWVEEAKLVASDQQRYVYVDAGDEYQKPSFGGSVSISGEVAFVGSACDASAPVGEKWCDSGTVYAYRFNGTDWVEEARVVASDAQKGFGISVVASDETLLVGTYRAAYVFEWNGTDWRETQKLVGSGTEDHDYWGAAVDLDGDVAIVSAVSRTGSGYPSAAFVFRHIGSEWVEEAKFALLDPDADDASLLGSSFGSKVAISGDLAVVKDGGAPLEPPKVFVFRRHGGEWIEEATLVDDDVIGPKGFSGALAISGDTILVGDTRHDSPDFLPGCVSIFRHHGGEWIAEGKLVQSDYRGGLGSDDFGLSVAISGDSIFVGARADGFHPRPPNAGSVYVFHPACSDQSGGGEPSPGEEEPLDPETPLDPEAPQDTESAPAVCGTIGALPLIAMLSSMLLASVGRRAPRS